MSFVLKELNKPGAEMLQGQLSDEALSKICYVARSTWTATVINELGKEEQAQEVWMLFGSATAVRKPEQLQKYEFSSLAELNAFLLGVDEMNGHDEVVQLDTEIEVAEYFNELEESNDC